MSDTGYRLQHVAREQVELQPWTPPDKPLGEHDVRGRSLCTLVSPGTELHAHYLAERFPSGSGYANVGEVLEVGSAVEVAGGRRRGLLLRRPRLALPDDRGRGDACARRPGPRVRHRGAADPGADDNPHHHRRRPGDIVLVSGCGPVGYLAAEIFRLSNYEVTIVEPHAGRRAMAEAAGHRTLPACPLEDPAYAKKVALVVECSGHEQAVLDALLVCRKLGEVAMVGVPWRQRTDLTAHAIVQAIFHNYVTLRTAGNGNSRGSRRTSSRIIWRRTSRPRCGGSMKGGSSWTGCCRSTIPETARRSTKGICTRRTRRCVRCLIGVRRVEGVAPASRLTG